MIHKVVATASEETRRVVITHGVKVEMEIAMVDTGQEEIMVTNREADMALAGDMGMIIVEIPMEAIGQEEILIRIIIVMAIHPTGIQRMIIMKIQDHEGLAEI